MGEKLKNIIVLTTWSYNEGLIQSSTLPYLKIINQITPHSEIFLVTQEKDNWFESYSEIQKVQSTLAPFKIKLIPQLYYFFGVKKIWASLFQFLHLWWIIITKKVSHIHCFCTPAGATGYLLSKLTRAKLVIDSYEPHAESMVENGTWEKHKLAFKLLWWFEKKQSIKASFCIAAASGMKSYAMKKFGISLNNFNVRPTCVDLFHFMYNPNAKEGYRKDWGWESQIVCVYAGKFGGIYLDQEVFDFFKVAYDYWKGKFRVLLLTNMPSEMVYSLCKKSYLPESAVYIKSATFEEMPAYLSVADFAITPVKPVPSKRFCSPIKDGEYWSIGLPVVITKDISDDSDIIEKYKIGAVLQSLDDSSYLQAIQTIDKLLEGESDILRQKIRRIADTYRNYQIALSAYRDVYKPTEGIK